MKKAAIKLNAKQSARLTTAGVSVIAIGILVATGWFIIRSLNDVAVAKSGNGDKPLKIEGVNNQLLDKVQKFVEDKKGAGDNLEPTLTNPFRGFIEPVPPPTATPSTPNPGTTPPSS